MVRPPMGPNITSAPLPLPPPPRALGRSQSLLPAYHTSVNYNGHGSGNGPQQAAAPPPPPPAELPQQVMERLPPPGLLLRQRSFSCLSRPFRHSTGRFLSENLARVEVGLCACVVPKLARRVCGGRKVGLGRRACV